MTMKRFNGISFSFTIGDFKIQAKKFTLDITDNSTFAKRNGRPDGRLQGDVEAGGVITVDRIGLRAVKDAASSAGAFQELEPFDIEAFATAGSDQLKINAFGCKIKINKLLDIDANSADEVEFELPFDVTSPDFVKIDGVPYIKALEDRYNS